MLKNLPTRCQKHKTPMLDIMELANRLDSKPFGQFPNLAEALGRQPTKKFIDLVSDLFLNQVDIPLQSSYRHFFATNPPPSNYSHQQRLDMLKAVEGEARTIVSRTDWDWLSHWLGIDSDQPLLWRLSNFAFPIQKVNFRLSYHCNFECAHCYNNSGPKRKAENLPLQDMLNIIAAMPALNLDKLNLTGGEPLLRLNDVEALIRAARQAGVKQISIYTNAYWAKTSNQIDNTLDRLEAAGFWALPGDYIKASAGIYHQPFIDLEPILELALRIKQRFNRPLHIDYEVAELRQKEEIQHRFAADRLESAVKLSVRVTAPVGRGKSLSLDNGFENEDITATSCQAINQIVFDPDNAIRPCCGLNNENLGIQVANLARHDLATALRRLQNDGLMQAIANQTMAQVANQLGLSVAGLDGNLCKACHTVVGNLSNRENALNRLFPSQRFYPFDFRDARL